MVNKSSSLLVRRLGCTAISTDVWQLLQTATTFHYSLPAFPRIHMLPPQPLMNQQHCMISDIPEISCSINSGRDKLIWRWESNELLSQIVLQDVVICWQDKINVYGYLESQGNSLPLLFFILLMRNKLLMQDTLCVRNISFVPCCVLCKNCPLETPLHLFFLYLVAAELWYDFRHLNITILHITDFIQGIFSESTMVVCSKREY
jgi:hypothetical protein